MSIILVERIVNQTENGSMVPDVICSEKLESISEAQASALYRVHHSQGIIIIRFEWSALYVVRDMDESDLVLVPETETLFFRTTNQWGAIDLRTATLVRHEAAMDRPMITKYTRAIVIEDELQAEATDFGGNRIETVPIDPPWEAEEFDDRIEYNSPVYGKQILHLQ